MKIPSSFDPSSQKGDSAMTPMIDVVFLLLIFFVCASAVPVAEVMISSPLKVTSSETSPEKEEEDKLVRLQIRQNEQDQLTWILTGMEQKEIRTTNLEELKNRLKTDTAQSEKELVLDIGKEITMGTALETYDLCDQLEFQKISFGVRKQ